MSINKNKLCKFLDKFYKKAFVTKSYKLYKQSTLGDNKWLEKKIYNG